MKKFRRRSARMNIRHYHVTMRRYFRQILTSPAQLLPLIFEPIAMLIILLLVAEKDAFLAKNSASVTSANIILFVLVIMAAMMGLLNSYREICKEREVLAREVFGGLDITADLGTQVLSMAEGTVTRVYDDGLMGTTVMVDHGSGLVSTYCGLAAPAAVEEGQQVARGAVLGAVGDTAIAESGMPPHLHLEAVLDGQQVDPLDYLPEAS